jgi:hypothetical protein
LACIVELSPLTALCVAVTGYKVALGGMAATTIMVTDLQDAVGMTVDDLALIEIVADAIKVGVSSVHALLKRVQLTEGSCFRVSLFWMTPRQEVCRSIASA